MKLNFKKEAFLILIGAIPLVFLYFNWALLPESVAVHFNIDGEPDNFWTKQNFVYLILGLNFFSYLSLLVFPFIDPKDQIKNMGNNYFKIRILMTVLISSVSIYLVYMSTAVNPN